MPKKARANAAQRKIPPSKKVVKPRPKRATWPLFPFKGGSTWESVGKSGPFFDKKKGRAYRLSDDELKTFATFLPKYDALQPPWQLIRAWYAKLGKIFPNVNHAEAGSILECMKAEKVPLFVEAVNADAPPITMPFDKLLESIADEDERRKGARAKQLRGFVAGLRDNDLVDTVSRRQTNPEPRETPPADRTQLFEQIRVENDRNIEKRAIEERFAAIDSPNVVIDEMRAVALEMAVGISEGPISQGVYVYDGKKVDGIQPQPWRLLKEMHNKQEMDATHAYQLASQDHAKDPTDSAIKSMIRKANHALEVVTCPKRLSKPKNVDKIVWG